MFIIEGKILKLWLSTFSILYKQYKQRASNQKQNKRTQTMCVAAMALQDSRNTARAQTRPLSGAEGNGGFNKIEKGYNYLSEYPF